MSESVEVTAEDESRDSQRIQRDLKKQQEAAPAPGPIRLEQVTPEAPKQPQQPPAQPQQGPALRPSPPRLPHPLGPGPPLLPLPHRR